MAEQAVDLLLRVLVEVVLGWVAEVLVLDQILEIFCLCDVFMEVGVVHGRLHVDQSIGNPHVFMVHVFVLLGFLLEAAFLDEASCNFLFASPLPVVLVLPLLLADKGSDDMLVLFESEPSLNDRPFILR